MAYRYIDTKRIQDFVTKVEKRKRYKRDSALVLRHLFEECGELSAALWKLESNSLLSRGSYRSAVGRELSDIICLSVYIADILKIDLNESIAKAMVDVTKQYLGVNRNRR